MDDVTDDRCNALIQETQRAIRVAEQVIAQSEAMRAQLDREFDFISLLTPQQLAEAKEQAESLFRADMEEIRQHVQAQLVANRNPPIHPQSAPSRLRRQTV